MRQSRAWYVLLLLVVVVLMLPAQHSHAQQLAIVTPAQITINAYNNEVITRNLRIQVRGAQQLVEVIPSDLVRASDGRAIPAQRISVSTSPQATELGGAQSDALFISGVQIDLRNVPAGEFAGELLVRFNGGEVVLPIIIRIKHPWPLPLLALVGGLVAGISLTIYRSQVQPQDELLARLKPIAGAVDKDARPPMPEAFRVPLNDRVFDVTAALNMRDLGTARSALARAEELLTVWRRQRDDWEQQLAHLASLEATLDEARVSAQARSQFADQVRQLERNAPTYSSAQVFGDAVATLHQRVQHYLDQHAALDALAMDVARLSDAAAQDHWRQTVAALREEHATLPLNEAAHPQHAAFDSKLAQRQRELAQDLDRQPRSMPQEGDDMAFGVPDADTVPPTTPTAIQLPTLPSMPLNGNPVHSAQRASSRLWLAFVLGYGIVLALLAAGGFAELYAKNAVFGANPWGDYLALLAWGFGAETSRMALTGIAGGMPNVDSRMPR